MATMIEQQVALDEALVPSTKRLRIGKSNFRLPSDIQSKESTLCTRNLHAGILGHRYVHQHSIRFKLDNKKHIVDLETFRNMLHICPRIPGQSFDELPFEAEILEFLRSFKAVINKYLTGKSSGFDSFRLSQAQILWGLYHSRNIDYAFLIWEDFVYQVEHKNQKKSNEMYYPRSTKVIVHHFMSKDLSIPRQNKVNWHYVRDDNIFSTIKVVSRHQNTQQYGAILPIELTNEDIRNTCAVTPRLTAAVKGKQAAKAKIPSDPLELARTEAQQLKIVLKISRQETHISQHGGSDTDEGTGSKPGVPDVPSDDSEEEISWNSSDDEETREEESFDPIPRTPEDIKDDGNGEEDQGLRISEEERIHEEEEADELYRDQESSSVSSFVTSMLNSISDAGVESIFVTASSSVAPLPTPILTMTPSIITTITTPSHPPIPPTPIPSEVLQNLLIFDLVFRFDERLKSLEATFSNILVAADLSEMELKKILIEKMEGNKSIQRSDEQRNMYKALVDAYEADKTILDSYRETAILKRRREDDDDQEGPSARSDWGSKRQREGGEPESARAPLEPATRSAGRSTTGPKSRQVSASEFAFTEEPVQTTSQVQEPSYPVFETGAENQLIVQTSQHPEWFPQQKKPLTPDRDWNKTLPATQGST
nr:hypothetical protein [Tanacetum cinerariifolium]